MSETKPEIGDIVSGFCQLCLQDASGRIVATRPYTAGARTLRLLSVDGREHRVIETVTQEILPTAEIYRRVKRRKEKEQEYGYETTSNTAATQYPTPMKSTSPNEYETLTEETEDFR